MTEFRPRRLCLALLGAVSLVAVCAPAAQATLKVNGEPVKSTNVTGTILPSEFTVWGISLKIQCTGGTLSGTVSSEGEVAMSMQLSGCSIPGSKTCTIYETAEEKGAGKITSSGEGKVTLHGGEYYVRLESEAFNTVNILGALCTLPEEMVASGSVALKLPDISSEQKIHLYESVSYLEELLEVGLQCDSQPASILGSEGHIQHANPNNSWSFK